NRGYDIESRDPRTGSLTFIEVKGRVDGAETITITRNEMLTAFNAAQSGLCYILAVVLVGEGYACEPVYVPEPTPIFGAEPGFTEVSRNLSLSKILAVGRPPA